MQWQCPARREVPELPKSPHECCLTVGHFGPHLCDVCGLAFDALGEFIWLRIIIPGEEE